ncbi:hypothetical protein MN608_11922 [Microdochium nivale]|nr:hypothetical protein MN608_11922 [Microdochium nivale]
MKPIARLKASIARTIMGGSSPEKQSSSLCGKSSTTDESPRPYDTPEADTLQWSRAVIHRSITAAQMRDAAGIRAPRFPTVEEYKKIEDLVKHTIFKDFPDIVMTPVTASRPPVRVLVQVPSSNCERDAEFRSHDWLFDYEFLKVGIAIKSFTDTDFHCWLEQNLTQMDCWSGFIYVLGDQSGTEYGQVAIDVRFVNGTGLFPRQARDTIRPNM